jgi:hypothetical protein
MSELREQDFGPFEGKSFSSKPRTPSKSACSVVDDAAGISRDADGLETKDSMSRRANAFIDKCLHPLLGDTAALADKTVAVVAHGLILSTLWRCLLRRLSPNSVTFGTSVMPADRPTVLEHLGAWSNTGVLDLQLVSKESPDPGLDVLSATDRNMAVPLEKPAVGTSPSRSTITLASATKSITSFEQLTMTIMAVNDQTHIRGLKRTRGGVGSSGHDASQRKIEMFFKKQKTK